VIRKLARLLMNPREAGFRIRQELWNLMMLMHLPAAPQHAQIPLNKLPDAEMLRRRFRGTECSEQIADLADSIRSHRIPLLGTMVETGPEIRWRRDYASGRETEPDYFWRIPYLDAGRAGDHKLIWELNRHQHLVILAQDALLHQREESRTELATQLEQWMEQNPFQRGINWASALEVAFRALSWIWIYHLDGPRLPAALRARFLQTLYRHGLHLEANLSHYFSPNTHLLGEAVALYALGVVLLEWPRSEHWRKLGESVLDQQLDCQVQADGSHFEHSSYYHVYALDMFLFAAALGAMKPRWQEVLTRMAVYLDALMGPSRRLPFIGDDDGGRFFHPFGNPAEYGRATLATAAALLGGGTWAWLRSDWRWQGAWWMPALPELEDGNHHPELRRFDNIGMVVWARDERQVLFDCGGFGWGRAGHSHSDALHIVVRQGEQEILIDPGTFSYSDKEQRNAFRGSAAHNTVRINGQDQAVPDGPFGWKGGPEIRLLYCEMERVAASCSYNGFRHVRRLELSDPSCIHIHEEIDGPPGEHFLEFFWHPADESALRQLELPPGHVNESGWFSPAHARREPAPVACLRVRQRLPYRCSWRLHWSSTP